MEILNKIIDKAEGFREQTGVAPNKMYLGIYEYLSLCSFMEEKLRMIDMLSGETNISVHMLHGMNIEKTSEMNEITFAREGDFD